MTCTCTWATVWPAAAPTLTPTRPEVWVAGPSTNRRRRRSDGHLVSRDRARAVAERRPERLRNGQVHGELEPVTLPQPDEVPKVRRALRDTDTRVAENRPTRAHLDQITEEPHDIEERRFAAGVRTHEELKAVDGLVDVPQAAVPQRLDSDDHVFLVAAGRNDRSLWRGSGDSRQIAVTMRLYCSRGVRMRSDSAHIVG